MEMAARKTRVKKYDTLGNYYCMGGVLLLFLAAVFFILGILFAIQTVSEVEVGLNEAKLSANASMLAQNLTVTIVHLEKRGYDRVPQEWGGLSVKASQLREIRDAAMALDSVKSPESQASFLALRTSLLTFHLGTGLYAFEYPWLLLTFVASGMGLGAVIAAFPFWDKAYNVL
jgi:hypothetical protein